MTNSFWIVGPGRVGLSLASLLADGERAPVLVIFGRRPRPPDHPLFTQQRARYETGPVSKPPAGCRVLLAVPDRAIAGVAAQVAGLGRAEKGCVALHLSGAQSARVLQPLADAGYAVASLHPLQTLADPRRGAERLRGAFFAFEGEPAARGAAGEIVEAAGGRMLEVHEADKASYHAACVFASNYVVTCAGVAARLLAGATGVSASEAVAALRPLWRGAVANLEDLDPGRALTGPVARGDIETIRANLAALEGDTRDLYRQLGLQALELSRDLGLEEGLAAAIEAELRGERTRTAEGE